MITFLGAAVAFGEELGGDAAGDFVRVVGAEIEADGAVEFFRERGREAVSHERAVEDGRFGLAADDADEGELAGRGRGKYLGRINHGWTQINTDKMGHAYMVLTILP